MDGATGDVAWLQAMLDVESALARAGASLGLIPADHASAIETACRAGLFDLAALAAGAGTEGTPVISLVSQLRSLLPADHARSVHLGATSQDVLDTALVLLARRAAPIALANAERASDLLADLAGEHRDTPQVGRTLLQHAAVTTFGLTCAVRVAALDAAVASVRTVLDTLPVQFGGAVGTLAVPGGEGVALMRSLTTELGLPAPVVPWHVSRGPMARLASSIGILAGELGGVAQDLVTLAGSEIGEVTPGAPGGSSAMPHKQNPARAVLAIACAHRTPGLVATVLAGMPQQLQRDPGRWQAEWGTLTELLRLLGGTARHTADALVGAIVHPDRMAAQVNSLLQLTGGEPDTGSAGTLVDAVLEQHRHRSAGGAR